ncbi:MAG: glycosyltransferase [Alphaproteobacteria bacterium]
MEHKLRIAEPASPAAANPPPRRKSVSKQMQERFERRKTWRRIIAVTYIAVLLAYLAWRFTIINPHSLGLSLLYYAGEVVGFILGLTAIATSWDYSHREPKPAPKNLSVDIFVPAYKEPIGIIRRTVMAAKAIDYPHKTFLLDDGKRDELKALAEELGVTYLRRPDNSFAKAGNLNFGLAHSTADFVMTFDADHIALPHALDVTLGFFDDEKVAFVQAPQDFYNTNAFQYILSKRSGGIWHDQSYFYNIVLPAGDSIDVATCVGTGVVYRRSALDAIGGIPTETITEDMHTAVRLHKKGFKSVYLNEPIAYGIAAADLDEYCTTRLRWGHGNAHVLSLENVAFCKGLTWRQRWQYLAMTISHMEGLQQLVMFMVPIIALTTGLQPFTITVFNVLVVLFFPLLSYLLLQEIGCGFTRYWANEVFAMARWPVYIKSFAGVFRRRRPFQVSNKNLKGRINWRLMAPQMVVMAASLAAVGAGIYSLDGHYGIGPLFEFIWGGVTLDRAAVAAVDTKAELTGGYTIDFVAIAGFWALYSAVRAGFFALKIHSNARNSHDTCRFDIPVPATVSGTHPRQACITAIAEDWARVTLYGGVLPKAGDELQLSAVLPAGAVPLKLRVENTHGLMAEGALLWDSPQAQDRLANGLYSVDWHREFLHRNAYFLTPSDVVLSLLRLQPSQKTPYRDWQAVLLQVEGRELYGVMARGKDSRAALVTFGYLPAGTEYKGLIFGKTAATPLTVKIMEERPLSSLVAKGLDGAEPRRYALEIVA